MAELHEAAKAQATWLFNNLRDLGVDIPEKTEHLLSPGVAAMFVSYHRSGMTEMRRHVLSQMGTVLDQLAGTLAQEAP